MDSPRLAGRHGFTIVELLLVVGILSILMGMSLVALDPARRFNQARNTTRWSDVTALLRAVKTYQADSGGALPGGTLDSDAATAQIIGEDVTCDSYSCPAGLPEGLSVPAVGCAVSDFDTALAAYLKSIPADPSFGSASDTTYWINKDGYGLIEIGTCHSQSEGSGGSGPPPTIRISS